jgi:P22 coat protein - gene protein 5
MAGAAITSANVAQAIVKLVAAQGLPAVMGAMVMGNLVNRDYEPTLANAGDTVNIPIPPVLTTYNVAEGGSVTLQNPSLGNAQIVLTQHAESTFTIPDVTAALVGAERGDFGILNKYLTPAMIAIAERIESDLLGLYTNLVANPDVGAGATTITENTIDLAEKALFDAKVPESEKKYLVLSSQAYTDARQTMRFTEDRTIGTGQAIVTGKIGTIKSFDVYRSQFVAKPSTTTYNLAFARDAFGLVIRRLPQPLPGTGAIAEYGELGNFGMRIVMSYQPNTLAQQFTVDVLYGLGVLRHIYGQRVLS